MCEVCYIQSIAHMQGAMAVACGFSYTLVVRVKYSLLVLSIILYSHTSSAASAANTLRTATRYDVALLHHIMITLRNSFDRTYTKPMPTETIKTKQGKPCRVLISLTVTHRCKSIAGNLGSEVVILAKEYLMDELLRDLPFAVRFFRDLATAISNRLNDELLLTYGTLWKSTSV